MQMPSPHRVAAIAYPGMSPFELSIVIEVFGLARPELDVERWYSVDVCAVVPGEQPALGGIGISVAHGLDALALADTVIVPGWCVQQDVPRQLTQAVTAAHRRGARLVSICSGVFVLAAAGLLNGRRAATHWRYAGLLATRYPDVAVDPSVLYVDDGDVLTSAGSAAGIDLCLHLIRSDHGAGVANHVARRLVVPAHRSGGQAQFIHRPVALEGSTQVHDVIDWMDNHLAEPMAVAALARRAHMSERHFARRFLDVTGQSPVTWLIARRVSASMELLENSAASIEQVATEVGFATAQTYRYHFRARTNTTPTEYRRAFGGADGAPTHGWRTMHPGNRAG